MRAVFLRQPLQRVRCHVGHDVRIVQIPMVIETQPANLSRFGVIVMVRLYFMMTTHIAYARHELTAPDQHLRV